MILCTCISNEMHLPIKLIVLKTKTYRSYLAGHQNGPLYHAATRNKMPKSVLVLFKIVPFCPSVIFLYYSYSLANCLVMFSPVT